MGQQRITRASGQRVLERVFGLRRYGTTTRTEVIAGLTIFLTMTYIVFASLQILGVASMDISTIFVTTHLIAASGSILIGLFTDLPVALAPVVDLNTFFVFAIVGAVGLSWQIGMGAIFWDTVGLLLLIIFRIRYWVIAGIPVSPRVGVASGIGLFISIMGPGNAGVIVTDEDTLVSIGNLAPHNVPPDILSFPIIVILALRSIRTAVLVSIAIAALLGWMLGDIHYNDIVSAPLSVMSVIGHADLADSFNIGLVGAVLPFILVNLLDSFDTLIGVTDKAGLADARGKFPHVKQALYVDNASSTTGAFIGISSATTYTESSSGVSVDRRTDLTAVVVGLLLLLITFLSPLAGTALGYAAVDALIYISVLMASNLSYMEWDDLIKAVLAFITAVMIPFSFSIIEGIALGFVSYYAMRIGTGRFRGLGPYVIIAALLLVLKIVFINVH